MLLCMCGIPGSGKTTLSQILVEQYGAVLYSYDQLTANHPSQRCRVRSEMLANIANDLRKGKTVVVDNVNTTLKMRTDMLTVFGDIDCGKKIIVMQTPFDVCIERNRNRKRRLPDCILYDLQTHYEQPTLAEGWDEIILYDQPAPNGGEKLKQENYPDRSLYEQRDTSF